MSKLLVGLIDYGVGNLASVRHSLSQIGFNCRTSNDPLILGACDLLLLPGVGSFRPAMQVLKTTGLDEFIVAQAALKRPILGLCLGMHLLTESSEEGGISRGLGLIPGRVIHLGNRTWHIGWNSLDYLRKVMLFEDVRDEHFYFNHSYRYEGPREYQMCTTTFGHSFAAVIQRNKTVGIQFHPEKSQDAGQRLLGQIIEELCRA